MTGSAGVPSVVPPAGVTLRRAEAADSAAVAEVWIASFGQALPAVRRAHDDEDVRRWVATYLVPRTEVWVATVDDEVVAMMALAPGWIEQLYVLPGRQGLGIGTALVHLAQQRCADEGWESLQLWTFQVNVPARNFYVGQGFHDVELTDGATNEEREPDVRMLWP